MRSRATIAAALGACAAVLASSAAAVQPSLIKQMQAGGLVVVIRHAITDQSKQDDTPVDLADCTTQRMLSAEGRVQARAIGRAFRRLQLPVGSVLTSRFCRTQETAKLAFGRAKVEPALLNTVASVHDDAWRNQIRAARRVFGTRPAPGRAV